MKFETIENLPLKTLKFSPISGNNPNSIVIFLHGFGSNARDLISLAPEMAKDLPDTIFLSVDAPEACDMAPSGYQWFSLQDRDPENVLKGLKSTQPIITEYINKIKEMFQIENNKIAFVGFSQGTMTALYNALYFPDKLAAVLGYSGALYIEKDKAQKLTNLPIMLVHGTIDEVVPFEFMTMAKTILDENGIDIKTIARPNLGHSIDELGLKFGIEFLKEHLYKK